MPEVYGYKDQLRRVVNGLIAQFGSPQDIGRITPDEVLRSGDLTRSYTARARAQILGRVIDEQRLEDANVLELATGTGEMARLIASAGKKLNITYSDIDTARVKRNLGDNAPVMELDLDRLGLPDNSQDAIICANLLDQSEPTEPHFSEILRVLKPGGKTVIITDLQPDEFAFYKRHKDEILLPFPSKDGDIRQILYLAMTPGQAERFGSLQPPALREFWFAYMDLKEPWERTLVRRITSDQQMPVLQRNLAMLVLQNRLGFDPAVIDLAYDFHHAADETMTRLGFQNVDTRLKQADFVGLPHAHQYPGTRYDYAFDRLTKQADPSLGPNVKESAYMGVITASK